MSFCSLVISVSSRTPRPGAAHPDHSAPGLGSRFSLMTPSVRSSVDYCMVSDAEALGHDLLQVHPAPAHDSMHGALRAGFNDLGELRQLLRREARRVAFRPAVLEPFWAPFIEAVHPVPQRLAVHATDPRGIGPAHPIQHRRKRQQTPT